MKVLITAPALDENENVSGISTVVRQLIEHFPAEFTHFRAGRSDGERHGAGWVLKQAALPFRFRRAIKNTFPDIIHLNTALTTQAIWRDAALSFIASKQNKPVVLFIHGGKFLLEDIRDPLTRRMAVMMFARSRSVTVLSEIEKENIARRWPDLHIEVLPNAVVAPDGAPPIRRNARPAIVFVGRMHQSKGLQQIVEASRALLANGFEFSFTCYGEGPMRDEFTAAMKREIGERFIYGGVVAGDAKTAAFERADIFLLPSLYGEGLPMAMLEAMAAGCVAVVSEMASISSVINDGENGFLVAPGDTDDLIKKMMQVLELRPKWPEIGNAAATAIRTRFSMGQYIEKLTTIYKNAIAKN